jgi:hypothetical protein
MPASGESRNPAGKGLVRIGGADIQESLSGFAGEDLGDHAF